jgi:hypothetical protein
MAEGRGRAAWAHTSAILALTANTHCDPRKHRAFAPGDFNPYGKQNSKPAHKTRDLSPLKAVFVDPIQGGRKHD